MLTNIRHQEDGTHFILRRENETLCGHLAAKVCNATGAQDFEYEEGRIALGGIFADVMGLGKTLTTLVSILRSSEDASKFARAGTGLAGEIMPTKATLVVVPSVREFERLSNISTKSLN